MTINDLIKMLDAGFTKADIMALTGAPKQEEPAPSPKQEEPAPAPKQEDPAPAPTQDVLIAKLEELNRNIIAMNIRNSQQPDTESVDDILATIIRPTFPNKEDK